MNRPLVFYDPYGVDLREETTDIRNWESDSLTPDNPFRYCGEYQDEESGLYYLLARYYDPTIGRFLNEDPIKNKLNWYVYANGNPIKYYDPTGLFAKNTKLNSSQTSNPDVVKLQRALVSLGYLDMSDGKGWGCFGPKTLAAVNKYKEDNNLWNFGKYKGVGGITTWEHSGLDIDNTYEYGSNMGTPETYGRGTYTIINGPSTKKGLTLGSVEAGITKIGGENKYGSWEVGAVSADAAAGVSTDYIGVQAGARLISAEGGVKIPLPFTEKSLYIGAEVDAFGIGFNSYYKDGKVKIGATGIFGGSIVLGIE